VVGDAEGVVVVAPAALRDELLAISLDLARRRIEFVQRLGP
jgi:hypothetical protein